MKEVEIVGGPHDGAVMAVRDHIREVYVIEDLGVVMLIDDDKPPWAPQSGIVMTVMEIERGRSGYLARWDGRRP